MAVYIRLVDCEAGARQRAPGLEKLLARASQPLLSGDWRRDAFSVIAGRDALPAVAAAVLHASVGAVPEKWVCLATPVHLVAGMTQVTLSAGGVLQLDPEEAVALAADFNAVFAGGGVRLLPGRGGELLCVADRLLEVSSHDPREVIGGDVFGAQPVGADAARLRGLMSEMELWLFEHAVNRTRATRGRAAITGLWLWGGGGTLSALPEVDGWTGGTDPLFAVFGTVAELPRAGNSAAGGVLVCDCAPGAAEWPEIELRWVAPLAAALRSGQIERLMLSLGDRVVTVEKGVSWRFWRHPRPWWEAFELQGNK